MLCKLPCLELLKCKQPTPRSMQTHFPGLRHVLLTVDEHADLLADLTQTAQDLLVAVHERQDRVRDAGILTELAYQTLHFPKVMSWDTREQVVNGLELETTVHKVHPRGTVDIHRGPQLSLRERLALAQVRSAHSPV